MSEKRKASDAPGGLLGNILSGVAAMPAQPKRPRTGERNMGLDPFQALAQKLHQIRDEFHTKLLQLSPGCAVEIEAKLGLLVSVQTDGRMGPFTPGAGAIVLVPQSLKDKHLRFKSGVSMKDFESYRAVQEEALKRPGSSKVTIITNAYTFGNERRMQTDHAGMVIMEHKTRELEFNVHLPSCPYDCRVTVSIERPLEPIERQEVGQDWESKRAKDRCSYSGGRSKWQADLTKVTTTQGSHHFNPGDPGGTNTERTFEVELELKAEDCTQWVRLGDAEAAKQRTCEVAQDLWLRISAMMPCEETAGQLKEVKEAELEIAGQRACLAPFEMQGGATSSRSSNDFPGTMPVGFSKKHIEKVQREKYWVSEKTDGVRHFLVVVQVNNRGPTALLYDRKCASPPHLPPLSVLSRARCVRQRADLCGAFLHFSPSFFFFATPISIENDSPSFYFIYYMIHLKDAGRASAGLRHGKWKGWRALGRPWGWARCWMVKWCATATGSETSSWSLIACLLVACRACWSPFLIV